LITLRSPWQVGDQTWPAGALLAVGLDAFRAGGRDFAMLYEPKPNTGLAGWTGTKSGLLVVELEDVKSRLYAHARGPRGWTRRAVPAPDVGSFSVYAFDEDVNDDYWFTETGFLTPTTLSLAGKTRRKMKSEPAFFDARGLDVAQHFATSKDGTKVPYFLIAKRGLALDGTNPTILDGYGGFERSMTPTYAGGRGHAWLARGGVYVVANIRGGGEYGPRWHQAALKHDRQRAYDDFIAVAEDLIARKVTSTPKLGVVGGSNGGLLVGVMLTQRPDLFGAVVCQVPLLDMKRFHKLLAGASWTAEYGDPDVPEDWAAIAKYSPYQNVRAGVRYPRSLFVTSTRDDRVHPGHARKMVARLLEHQADVLYYENMEGGHGAAADNAQRARLWALTFTFFGKQLGL
jgi:prolyl oligopeptidase